MRDVVLVGNTAMHHLFGSLDITPLSAHPFEPVVDGVQVLTADQAGLSGVSPHATVRFLPSLGSFVGSDLLAGAFANYINRASARRIGLIRFPPEKLVPAGNTALLGAKLALFNLPSEEGACAAIRSRTRHAALNEDPEFMEIYVEEMAFPSEKACKSGPAGVER